MGPGLCCENCVTAQEPSTGPHASALPCAPCRLMCHVPARPTARRLFWQLCIRTNKVHLFSECILSVCLLTHAPGWASRCLGWALGEAKREASGGRAAHFFQPLNSLQLMRVTSVCSCFPKACVRLHLP